MGPDEFTRKVRALKGDGESRGRGEGRSTTHPRTMSFAPDFGRRRFFSFFPADLSASFFASAFEGREEEANAEVKK